MVAAAAAAGVGSEEAEVIPAAGVGVVPAVPPVLVPPGRRGSVLLRVASRKYDPGTPAHSLQQLRGQPSQAVCMGS